MKILLNYENYPLFYKFIIGAIFWKGLAGKNWTECVQWNRENDSLYDWRYLDFWGNIYGAGWGIWTPDLRFTKPLHYHCANPAFLKKGFALESYAWFVGKIQAKNSGGMLYIERIMPDWLGIGVN